MPLGNSEKYHPDDVCAAFYEQLKVDTRRNVGGVVYTPKEIVDYMWKSVSDSLELYFDSHLNSLDVDIVDPFCGPGLFAAIANLRDYISPSRVSRMKNFDICEKSIEHAKEWLGELGSETINTRCLNTFSLYDELDSVLDNNINVIIGNPPYYTGKGECESIRSVDEAIKNTYVKDSKATSKMALYDHYVRAVRWATDLAKLGKKGGVVCYVIPSTFVDAFAFDGLRKHLCDDFKYLHILDLRGNGRISGESRTKAGGLIFDGSTGGSCRLPIGIFLGVVKHD